MHLRPPAVYQLAVAVLTRAAGGCTASSGRAVPARQPSPLRPPSPPGRVSSPAVGRRSRQHSGASSPPGTGATGPFGRLFDADGAFAFAGKYQDTLRQGSNGGYTAVAGRQAVVAALARRQWVLGERLSCHGMTIYAGAYAGRRGGQRVRAFPGRLTQPLERRVRMRSPARTIVQPAVPRRSPVTGHYLARLDPITPCVSAACCWDA
jgi:hypothetical protein